MSEVRVHATFEVTDVDSFLFAAKSMVTATQVTIYTQKLACVDARYVPGRGGMCPL